MTKMENTLTFKIDNPKFLFDSLQTIEAIDYDCVMHICSTGCKVVGIDPSRVAMFEFKYGEIKDTIPVGIRLDDLSKIIDRIKSAKSIIIHAKQDRFTISTDIKGTSKNFTLSGVTVQSEKLPFDSLLSLPYQKRIMIDTGELIDAMKDIQLVSDSVTIGFKDNKLTYFGSSPTGEIKLETQGYESADLASSYSVPLILSKMKGMIGYKVSMFVGNELPLFFNYENENGYLRIFIAPKVETNDF